MFADDTQPLSIETSDTQLLPDELMAPGQTEIVGPILVDNDLLSWTICNARQAWILGKPKAQLVQDWILPSTRQHLGEVRCKIIFPGKHPILYTRAIFFDAKQLNLLNH